MDHDTTLFSVVICTYNRADLLDGALASLAAQELDPRRFEVLVIDNASTDGTRAVVAGYSARHPHVRYIHEPRQGASAARNRGYQEAHGQFIAFSDDDNRLPPDWLSLAATVAERTGAGIFGGPSRAFFLRPPPPWFRETYGVFSPDWPAGPLGPEQFLSANNMFVRRDIIDRLGGFDLRHGPRGDRTAYGEETDLIIRSRRTLPAELIVYEPRLYVYHVVRPVKASLRWRAIQQFRSGEAGYHVFGQRRRRGRPTLAGLGLIRLGALAAETLYALALRDRRRYPAVQNYLYERTTRHFWALGSLWEAWNDR